MSALADRPAAPDPERHPAGVAEILDKALDGERITDAEALALLRVARPGRGRAGRQRAPRPPRPIPTRITFIVDRNLNYTNICVTDCDFCAFYRRPGDRREGYLLPEAGDLQEDRGDPGARRHRRS